MKVENKKKLDLEWHVKTYKSLMSIPDNIFRIGAYELLQMGVYEPAIYLEGMPYIFQDLVEEDVNNHIKAKYIVFKHTMENKIRERTLRKEEYEYLINIPYERVKKDIRRGKVKLDRLEVKWMKKELDNQDRTKKAIKDGRTWM